jgi:L-ribulose-5-phosphate 4-epimerase
MIATPFSVFRQEVHWANTQLPKSGLVTMHSGNASGYDKRSGIILIKPSGVDYEKLAPEDLVALRLDGKAAKTKEIPDKIQSSLKPSVDSSIHLALYRADSRLGGIVHTHSCNATAWAALGKSIPCSLTAMADEFGGPIPCAPYVDPIDEKIIAAILHFRSKGPAVLLRQHGVFTFDATPRAALKAAIMVEDVARTLTIASGLGKLTPLAKKSIRLWWNRYHTRYGQPLNS